MFSGRPAPWTEEELKMIGTRPDREVAKLLNRSLSSVKGKKFQLLREKREQGGMPGGGIEASRGEGQSSSDANRV